MTDLSPVIPNECDEIIVKERFVNEGVKFTGTEYNFIFKKHDSFLGISFSHVIKSDVVRSDLFLRTDDVELSGKPSFNEFQEFVKSWKATHEEIGSWAVVDHHYLKAIE